MTTCCIFKLIMEIKSVLTKYGELGFCEELFQIFYWFPTRCVFQFTIISFPHSREINEEDVGKYQIWLGIGKGKREFCLVIGLKFSRLYIFFNEEYVPIHGGIHEKFSINWYTSQLITGEVSWRQISEYMYRRWIWCCLLSTSFCVRL